MTREQEIWAYQQVVQEQGRALGKIDAMVQEYPYARELCDRIHQIIQELYPNEHTEGTEDV